MEPDGAFRIEQELLDSSRRVLSLREREPLTMAPILKGGSDRHFFRLKDSAGHSWIVMRYGIERRENALFPSIAEFLHQLGVHVPRILHHDATTRTLWMQDLGAADLYALSGNGETPDLALFERSIQEVSRLHRDGWAAAKKQGLQLMPGFDEALYAWERNYFYEEFLHTVCGRLLTATEQEKIEAELAPVAAELVSRTNDLVHRDFQSQNILLHAGQPFLIDFQGMRLGVRHYDLASLIYDPYMNFHDGHREQLAAIAYREDGNGQDEAAFHQDLHNAAIQRLMQALGAYGMLGINKGRTAFLQHIPRAFRNLQYVLAQSRTAATLQQVLLEEEEQIARFGP